MPAGTAFEPRTAGDRFRRRSLVHPLRHRFRPITQSRTKYGGRVWRPRSPSKSHPPILIVRCVTKRPIVRRGITVPEPDPLPGRRRTEPAVFGRVESQVRGKRRSHPPWQRNAPCLRHRSHPPEHFRSGEADPSSKRLAKKRPGPPVSRLSFRSDGFVHVLDTIARQQFAEAALDVFDNSGAFVDQGGVDLTSDVPRRISR